MSARTLSARTLRLPGRPPSTSHGQDAREPLALRIVRQAFDAWNRRDVERYAALLDDGYVGETHRLTPPLRGREAARRAMETSLQVVPDLRFTIQAAVARRNAVLVSWLVTGTPRSKDSGASLTARPLRAPGCTVTRVRGRKIVHTWDYWDMPTCPS